MKTQINATIKATGMKVDEETLFREMAKGFINIYVNEIIRHHCLYEYR